MKFLLGLGTVCLTVRSFCELVITGQLDRWPANLERIHRARDVTYGLFTVLFILFMVIAIEVTPSNDSIFEEDRRFREEVKSMITTQYATTTEDGRLTAPPISELFDLIQEQLNQERKEDSSESVEWKLRIKSNELKRMRKQFGSWAPIFKGHLKKDEVIEMKGMGVSGKGEGELNMTP